MALRGIRNVILAAALLVALVSVTSLAEGQEVVVYTALDRNFSEPIFKKFTAETGIKVLPKYDTESTKTVGLVNAIIAEANRPRCDVFWNNEIVNTIRLQGRGLLQSCRPENAMLYPDTFKDPQGLWYGFAARARVLIVNTNLLGSNPMLEKVSDLSRADLNGKTGIAKPLFGTTASHAACLFSRLGEKQAQAYIMALKTNNIVVESGNKSCAVNVARGRLTAAMTDTDDAIIELRGGAPVSIVFPDDQEDGLGTLLIPNTLALINGCPHPEEGCALINYLLSPEIESLLSQSESAQIPLNSSFEGDHVLAPLPKHYMEVDFRDAADQFEDTAVWLRKEFLSP